MQNNTPWGLHREHRADAPDQQRHRRPHPPRFGDPDARGRHPHGGGPGFRGRGPRDADGPWGGPHPGHRPRGRAGRGDVRTAVLLLLQQEPMHGYQLMQAVADRTGGAWRMSPGAVYPTIAQLEDEGLLTVSNEGGRKLATLTDTGYQALTALGDVDPFAAFTGPDDRIDLRGAVHELTGAAHQLARAGDRTQLQEADRILQDTKRALYLLLAGEHPTSRAATIDPEPEGTASDN